MQILAAGRVLSSLSLMLGIYSCHSSLYHERTNPRDGLKVVWIARAPTRPAAPSSIMSAWAVDANGQAKSRHRSWLLDG